MNQVISWDKSKKILIWGTGAIGGVVAAYLTRAGHQVHAVDIEQEHVDAINTKGITISESTTSWNIKFPTFVPANVTEKYELIILCVKAQHTSIAMAKLIPHLSDDGYVLSMQNGLNERTIAEVIGPDRTIACLVNFSADYQSPGHILYGSAGALRIGEMSKGVSPRLLNIQALLKDFEPNVACVDNIWPYKWGKLAYGSLLFLTAVSSETMYESLSNPEYQTGFAYLAQEIIKIADLAQVETQGFDGFDASVFRHPMNPKLVRSSLDQMAAQYQFSGKQRSGVWRDLAVRKRKTEIDAQIGEIVRVAEAMGEKAPITQILINMIHQIESGERAISPKNLYEFNEQIEEFVV